MAEGEKKTERKNLTITQVEEIKKVGKNQIPKLPFKAKEGDTELLYFTFKGNLFEFIKEGQIINADVETSNRDWEGTTYTDRRVVQIYIDGQPIAQKRGDFYRGKSPEELEQSARVMTLSYAKDLAVADKIPVVEIINQAEVFYNWVKKNSKAPEIKPEVKPPTQVKTPAPEEKAPETNAELVDKAWEKIGKETPPAKIQNIPELKSLLMKHKIGTHEVYEILSIKSFMDLTDLDEAWEKIKKAKGI